jgi:tellurite methyltransferase
MRILPLYCDSVRTGEACRESDRVSGSRSSPASPTMEPPAAASYELRSLFGDIDIYLFDQISRGRFDARRRVLDAGCAGGRNLPYFLTRGYEVFAIDRDPSAAAVVARLAARLAPRLPADHVRQGQVEVLPWPDESMDAVLSSAVLHFAADAAHFHSMVVEMWRVLAPGGLLFARLATSITIEDRIAAPTGRVRLPDGSDRFVVDEAALRGLTESLGGRMLDPLKTTNVENQRAMTTWVVGK